jgi:rubrerythrin
MAGKSLKGSKSHENLKDAFAAESQANRRYLYFARVADIEGFPDIAGLFKDTADAETGHAFGHLDFLKEVGDPVTGEPIGTTEKNLRAAVAGETYGYTEMYPGMAETAHDEGYPELAEWFETLARAEKPHAGRFTKGVNQIAGKEPAEVI